MNPKLGKYDLDLVKSQVSPPPLSYSNDQDKYKPLENSGQSSRPALDGVTPPTSVHQLIVLSVCRYMFPISIRGNNNGGIHSSHQAHRSDEGGRPLIGEMLLSQARERICHVMFICDMYRILYLSLSLMNGVLRLRDVHASFVTRYQRGVTVW